MSAGIRANAPVIPVIVGTSLYGKSNAPTSKTPKAPSTAPTNAALDSITNAAIKLPGLPGLSVDNSMKTFGAPDTGTPITVAQILAAQSAAKGSKPNLAGYTPKQFAAALRIAKQINGPDNLSAYEDAIGAAQREAATSEGAARSNTNSAIGKDNALYAGLVSNEQLAGKAGRQDTRATVNQDRAAYNATGKGIQQIYGQGNASTASNLAGLGINMPNDTVASDEENFLRGENRSNKANSTSDERNSGSAFNQLNRQTIADSRATGVADTADERQALVNTLAGIRASLDGTVSGLHGQEASAEAAYQSALRGDAFKLIQTEQANNPNSLANRTKQAELNNDVANNELKLQQIVKNKQLAGTGGPHSAENTIDSWIASQLPNGGQEQTDALDWLNRAIQGDLGTTDLSSPNAVGPVNSSNLAKMLAAANKVSINHPQDAGIAPIIDEAIRRYVKLAG